MSKNTIGINARIKVINKMISIYNTTIGYHNKNVNNLTYPQILNVLVLNKEANEAFKTVVSDSLPTTLTKCSNEVITVLYPFYGTNNNIDMMMITDIVIEIALAFEQYFTLNHPYSNRKLTSYKVFTLVDYIDFARMIGINLKDVILPNVNGRLLLNNILLTELDRGYLLTILKDLRKNMQN